LEEAFWIRGIAFNKAFWAPSRSFFSTDTLTFFTKDFTVDLIWRFRSLLFSFCLARLIADKWVAKIQPPFLHPHLLVFPQA